MLTRQLSDFLHKLTYSSLSPETAEAAKMAVEDLMGVALAGASRPQGAIWNSYFSSKPSQPEATVWGPSWAGGLCEYAAALNAACSHILDMDDVHNSSITHLGAVTIPAALAVGQKYHRSGEEVLAAIVAGYEIGARIGEAINPASYHYWHTTSVVGSFSSAVAAGKLMGLSQEQLLHAIGSAGTQSAGLWQFLVDGAMSKTLHTANATLCGIRSAQLASLGFTAAQDILTGERGLLGAMTPDNHPELLVKALEKGTFKILSNSLKPYACCRHTHSADYCVELIQKKHRLDPKHIVRITDYTYQVAKDTVDSSAPATPYGFKFSVQYCIAAGFLYGNLQDEVFTEEKTANREARRLMACTHVVVDQRLEDLYQRDANQWPHRLEVELDSGEVLIQEVIYPFGDFNNPFDWETEHTKFRSLTQPLLSAEAQDALISGIPRLETLEDINTLFPASSCASPMAV